LFDPTEIVKARGDGLDLPISKVSVEASLGIATALQQVVSVARARSEVTTGALR